MQAVITCDGGAIPSLIKDTNKHYEITCSDGSIPSTAPIALGLSDLAWSDVMLLASALLTACVLATTWNILGKLFHRG